MNIGIDIDDTLADFCGDYHEKLCEVSGRAYKPVARFPQWDWVAELGFTPEHKAKVWDQISTSTQFWMKLRPLVDAPPTLLTLFNLYQHGHNVYFLTHRSEGIHVHVQTVGWLMAYGYPVPQVLLSKEKGKLAQALNLDMFIDDKPENCWEVKAARPECKVFLIKRFDYVPEAEAKDRGVEVVTSCRHFFEALDKELAANALVV